MKHLRGLRVIATAAVAVIIVLALAELPELWVAGPTNSVARADSGCSLATLKGPYAIAGQGTTIATVSGLPAPPAPFAESALANFDGAGAFSGHATVNIGGVALNASLTGTYTVNTDCTGTLTANTNLGLTVQEALVVTGGGQRFISTETDPLAVVQRRAERLGD